MALGLSIESVSITKTDFAVGEVLPRYWGTVNIKVVSRPLPDLVIAYPFENVSGGIENAITRALRIVQEYAVELGRAAEKELSSFVRR